MSFLVRGQYEAFGQYAQRVLTEAGAIALGIICVASLMNIIAGLRVRARAANRALQGVPRRKKPSVSCMIKGIFRMRYKHAGRENAMKIMAVDYGDGRTGLACDRTEFLASPIGIIEEKSLAKVAKKIVYASREYEVGMIVIGLPKTWTAARPARPEEPSWPIRCGPLCPFPWSWDERQTTVSAANILSENGTYGKKRKDVLDAVAATVILESYMAYRRNTGKS